MRNEFANTVTELAMSEKELVLLAGDIGNKLFDKFKEQCPERFYNCGVAEANMTGVASGLAASGLRPITYTITPFNTARCFEQIRLDVCYPNHPVIIVGTGAGLSYASLGATHHSMEDIAILRTLPNLQIVCPGDPVEVRQAINKSYKSKLPTYIRLGKKGEPNIHRDIPEFVIGKSIYIERGQAVSLISVGNVLGLANECWMELKQKNINADLISMHTVKPLDIDLLEELFKSNKIVVLIEEHGLVGGAGSAVLEWANASGYNTKDFLRFGGPDMFLTGCGNQFEAREYIGLSKINIINSILEAL